MKARNKRSCLALSLLTIAVSQAVYAAEEAITELPAVTVTVGRGENLQEMDMSTTVMTREQVQDAPAPSVQQIINKIPGVFAPEQAAGQIHPTGQVFSLRGFGTTTNINTLVMVDGIPINDPYFRTLDWEQVPKDSIERIEVIRGGGATSLWGNLAMGGIVNIVTREPVVGEKRINASYGSFNTKAGDAAFTLSSSETLKLGVNFGGTQTDGYHKTPIQYRSPQMVPTASHAGKATVSAYYTPSQDSKYYLKVFGHKLQEHGALWSITSNSWDKYQINGGGSTKLSGGGSININGWFDKGEMDTTNAGYSYNILTPTAAVTPYVSHVEQAKNHSMGGSLFYKNDFKSINGFMVGADFRGITADDNENFFGANGAQTSHILIRAEHRFQGIFAQGTYRPSGIPLDITVGLREDFFQTIDAKVANQVGTAAAPTTINNLANKSYRQFDPRIGAKYYFENGFDVRGAVYKNFAAQGMNQMYRSTRSGTNYLAYNAVLSPQSNIGKEIGIDYIQPGFDVAFTIFSNNLSNYIDYAPVCVSAAAGGCDTHAAIAGTGFDNGTVKQINQYVNAGNVVLKGVELLGNWQVSETVRVNGGVTRTIAYLTSSAYPTAAPTNLQLGQVPSWMATLAPSWQATPNLKLTLQVKSFPEFWNNTAHTVVNSAATLADVGFSYKLSKTADFYGTAQNIGSKSYYDSGLQYTTINRTALTTSTIPSLGIPLNVNIGVRVSF